MDRSSKGSAWMARTQVTPWRNGMGKHRADRRARRTGSTPKGAWRRRAAVAMAALVVAGAGGIATQAGFNAAVDTNLSANIGEVKVLAGGSSTDVTVAFTDDKFGNTLGPGEHTATVTIKNDGTLPIDIDWAKD